MKIYCLLLLLLSSVVVFSQEKTRILVAGETKRSIFNATQVNTLGLKVGYKYGCRVNIGFGVHNANDILFDYQLDPFRYPNASTSLEAKLTYVTLFVEPIMLADKNKVFSIPVSFGGGNLNVQYRELNTTNTKPYFNEFLPVIDVSGAFMVKIIPLVWLGGGVGYRHFFHTESFVNTSFNSPYYMFKLKVGRPCKKAGAFYKWRKNLFNKKKKDNSKKDSEKKKGLFGSNK